jgi:hypothetical protein
MRSCGITSGQPNAQPYSRARRILVIRLTRSPAVLHNCQMLLKMQQLRCLNQKPSVLQSGSTFRRPVLRARLHTRSATTGGGDVSVNPVIGSSSASNVSAVGRYEGVAYGGEDKARCTPVGLRNDGAGCLHVLVYLHFLSVMAMTCFRG